MHVEQGNWRRSGMVQCWEESARQLGEAKPRDTLGRGTGAGGGGGHIMTPLQVAALASTSAWESR